MDIFKKIKEKGFKNSFSLIGNRILKIPHSILIPLKIKDFINNYYLHFVQNLDATEIKKRTLTYIENMRIKDSTYGIYKYSKNQTKPVLYASLYAVLTRHLYRDLNELSKKQIKEWIDYIQSFQDDDGLFKDPNIANKYAAESDWWGWRHLTLHTIMALTALKTSPAKKFKIIDKFENKNFVINWLESQDWVINPANTSNKVQNYFTFLQYARDFQGVNWAEKSLELAYEWLNEHQDKITGLWGKRFHTRKYMSQGVQTGYHIWLLYFYDKKEIKYKEKIIESCLLTQNELGGFGVSLNSSACEDIDSIDPLIRLSSETDYKKNDIYMALKKAIPWILINMNEDGGFVFRRLEPFVYGHILMSSKKDESGMFPTWFRSLALAYIGKCLPETPLKKLNCQFIRCPGHQFWKD